MVTTNLNGKQFRISLRLRSTKENYNKAISACRTLSEDVKKLRKELLEYITKAESILDRLPNPSKQSFTSLFKSETDLFSNNKTNIIPFFQLKASQYFKEERFSTASLCKLALNSLLRYKPVIFFEDVDEQFLKGYVKWMGVQGNSTTTCQIYLRNLRILFNELIKQGVISAKHYPFASFKIGTTAKSKSVLYPAQLQQLLMYKTVGVMETRAKAFFFFCYLGNGMNFRDLTLLKFKNIQGEILTFVRHKTRNSTTSGAKEIKVYMHEFMKSIIKEWGNASTSPDDYIFPIVKKGMTALEMEKIITRYKRVANKMLTRMGKALGLEVHLCLNLARHSYATKLKIDGVNVTAISDALGHTSTNTTEHYMKSLPNEQLKVMSANLLSFTKA